MRERSVWFLFNRRVFGWKVHLLHGSFAWELQIGTRVIQFFYRDSRFRLLNGGAWRVWTDEYGARSRA